MLIGRASASAIPNELPTMGLDMCGDNLCFGHVVPGVTTYSAAKTLLSQYITRDEEGHFHGNKDGNIEILVRTDWSGDSVTSVNLQATGQNGASPSLPLRQIIERFGIPCYVDGYRPFYGSQTYANPPNSAGPVYSGGLTLVYPNFTIQISGEQARLSLDSAIDGITLRNAADSGFPNRTCSGSTSLGGAPWRGFASLDVYDALMRRDDSRPQSREDANAHP